jgi:hypothetical protein
MGSVCVSLDPEKIEKILCNMGLDQLGNAKHQVVLKKTKAKSFPWIPILKTEPASTYY